MKSKVIKNNKGFTLIEVLVTITIIVLLITIALSSFLSSRKEKQLETITNNIVFILEEAKSNSLAGKNGSAYGVKFNSNSYIYFEGESYNPLGLENKEIRIANGFEIYADIENASDVVIFSRMSGEVGNNSSIIVRDVSDSSRMKEVAVGVLGDITVID